MWGNLTGWFISLLLALGMGAGLTWSARPQKISPPTGDAVVSFALAPVAAPKSLSALLVASEPGDAGKLYRSAIALYQQDPAPYDAFRQNASLAQVAGLAALTPLVKAAHASSASIFRDNPSELIDYKPEHPPLEVCKTLGNIAIAVGLLYRNDRQYDESRRYLDAGLALGARLFDERLTFEELGAGLGLMRGAAQSLDSLAKSKGDGSLATAAEQFIKDSDAYRDQLINTYKIVGAIDEDYAGPYTGDIFQIANSSTADSMWRVEAIKHLGHYKYNAISRTDGIAAKSALKRLSEQAGLKPAVRAAAIGARDLTLEQHRASR